MSDRPLSPVGRCIYCGATTFKPSGGRLAEEHIIPLGLSGKLILPEASCKRCGDITGRVESIWLRGSLLGCRTLLGLPTRNPKDRPKALPIFDTTTKPNRKIMVAIKDYPVTLLLPMFAEPALLTGEDPLKWGNGLWTKFFSKPDANILAWKYGITGAFVLPMVNPPAVARSLAKTAHSFAVAALGDRTFEPLLPNYILGNDEKNAGLYVGAEQIVPPPQADIQSHQLQLTLDRVNGTMFLVASIRLFAWLGTPVYRVVVGKELTGQPLEPLLRAAV